MVTCAHAAFPLKPAKTCTEYKNEDEEALFVGDMAAKKYLRIVLKALNRPLDLDLFVHLISSSLFHLVMTSLSRKTLTKLSVENHELAEFEKKMEAEDS